MVCGHIFGHKSQELAQVVWCVFVWKDTNCTKKINVCLGFLVFLAKKLLEHNGKDCNHELNFSLTYNFLLFQLHSHKKFT